MSELVCAARTAAAQYAALASRTNISHPIRCSWSNAKKTWANESPMDADGMLLQQAKNTKAINPAAKVFVYRNIVKALPWFSQVNFRPEPMPATWTVPRHGRDELRRSAVALAGPGAARRPGDLGVVPAIRRLQPFAGGLRLQEHRDGGGGRRLEPLAR